MPSNFPSGFKSGLNVLGLPVLQGVGGNVFWVNSVGGADSAGQPGTQRRPFATLDYAVGRTTASNGDVILVAPKHAETIATATALAVDVAGLTVVGLGVAGQRPTFTLSATDSVCTVSAADVHLRNLVFVASIDSQVAAIIVGATNVTLEQLEFQNTGSGDMLTPIKVTSTTSNVADGLTVIGCYWFNESADALEFIELNGTAANWVIEDNIIISSGTAGPILLIATTKALTGAIIDGNWNYELNTAGFAIVDSDGANTGIITNNICHHLDTSSPLFWTESIGFHGGRNWAPNGGDTTKSFVTTPGTVYNNA